MTVSDQATMAVLAHELPTAGVRTTSLRNDRRDYLLRRMLASGDAASVLIALIVALAVSGWSDLPTRLVWGLFAIPLMVLQFKIFGLYDRDVKRISHSTVDDIPWVLNATLLGALILRLYSKVTPMHGLDLFEAVSFGLLTFVLVIASRCFMRYIACRLTGPSAAVLVGGGRMGDILASKLSGHPEYRCRVVGVLGDCGSPSEGLPLLGQIQELDHIAVESHIDRVIVSPGDIDDHDLEDLLRRCRKLSLKVSLLPSLSDLLGRAVEIDDVEGVTVLGVNPPWLPRSSRALKRLMDVTAATTLALVLTPLMLLIALVIKFDSRGSVFFVQNRVGRGGRRFRLLKFRTMVADAEKRRHELLALSTDPNWLKLDDDPRVTRVGRLLRRSSLDELPQLWNVLRGEMSLVGPRPLIEAEDERVSDWARSRLDLTPGITGYWQVLGRTRIPFEEMVKLDYLYVMNWSLWEDIRLMLKTLSVVVAGHGAN